MKCEKCGYEEANRKIKVNGEEKALCSVCSKFAPKGEELKQYLKEKVDKNILDTFRKFNSNKQGMERKARQGKIVSRAPYGYKVENKKLIPDKEKKLEVEEMFMDFLQNTSLNKLAQKYGFSFNGIKKVLKNFTYIGKIKFDGQVHEGRHEAIISPSLFNKVQKKLDKIKKTK